MTLLRMSFFNGVTQTRPEVKEFTLQEAADFFTPQIPPVVTKENRTQLFSMALYKSGTTRAKDNIDSISGIVLDFDNKGKAKVEASNITNPLDDQRVIYFFYTTYSHTFPEPRWRLVVPFVEPISLGQWKETYNRFIAFLGLLPGIDHPASKDATHMWFVPYKPESGTFFGTAQRRGFLLNPLKLPEVKQAPGSLVSFKPSDVLSPSYPKLKKEDTVEALKFIDPDSPYDDWLKIGAALHHHFGEEGLEIWDWWSQKGQKYKGREDLLPHWKTFRDKPNSITIGTLLHYAKQAGFKNQPSEAQKQKKEENPSSLSPNIEEEIEEIEEIENSIENALEILKPFACKDIYEFPCPILKKLYDWINQCALIPIPLFSLGTALSIMSFLKRDSVQSYTKLKTNLYIMLIGPSRMGKQNSLNCIHRVLKKLDLIKLGISKFGSAQGLLKHLSENEGKAYWIQDELAHLFKNIYNKNAMTHETRLEQYLLSLYNCEFITTEKIKNEEIKGIKNPFLNLLGVTTESIIEVLHPNSAISGLLARFLIFWFQPEDQFPEDNDFPTSELPSDLLVDLKNIEIKTTIPPVHFTNDAKDWYKAFCKTVRRLQLDLYKEKTSLDSLVGILPEQSMKLALLTAVEERRPTGGESNTIHYQYQTYIRLEDIQWAVSIIIHCVQNNMKLAARLTTSNNEEYMNKILERLQKTSKYLRRWDLGRAIRHKLTAQQITKLLLTLIESGQIEEKKSSNGKGTLYRLTPLYQKNRRF